MKVPRSSEESNDFFRSLVPDEATITIRPMFGNLAGFVNGNMFAGLFGDSLFVRLSEIDRTEFLKIKGTGIFSPMEGRPMTGYFVVPKSWMDKPNLVKPWVAKALQSTKKMPAKVSAKRAKTPKK